MDDLVGAECALSFRLQPMKALRVFIGCKVDQGVIRRASAWAPHSVAHRSSVMSLHYGAYDCRGGE